MSATGLLRRILKWTAIALGALVLLVVGLLVFVLGTEAGGRTLVGLLDRPEIPVSIESYSGRLGGRFELRHIQVDAPPMSAHVERLAMDWRPLDLFRRRLQVDLIHLEGVDVTVDEPTTTVEEIEPEAAPADSLPTAIELPLDVVLGRFLLDDLEAALPGGLSVHAGRLEAAGTPENYRVAATISASLEEPPLEAVDLALAARGDLSRADVDEWRIDLLGGSMRLLGSVEWMPALHWNVEALVDTIQPAALLPDPTQWPGSVSLRLHTTGRLERGLPLAHVDLDSLGGMLRGHPIGGHAALGVDGERVDLDELVLSWGAAGLRVAGHITDEAKLDFAVETSDLGIALPGAGGAIAVEGTVRGPRLTPRIAATLAADSLVIAEHRIAHLAGAVDVDAAGERPFDVDLQAHGILAGGQPVDSLAIDARGTMHRHGLDARVEAEPARLHVQVAGGLADSTWQGSIETLDISSAAAGDWALATPVPVVVGAARASVGELCLVSGEAQVCVEGERDAAGALAAAASITALPLDRAGPLLPAGWSIDGTLDGRLRAAVAADGALDGELELEPGPGTLGVALGDTVETIRFATTLTGSAGADGVRAELHTDLERGTGGRFGSIAAALELPQFTSLADTGRTQPLAATAQVAFEDLSPISIVAPGLSNLGGTLSIDAEAGGTLRETTAAGQVSLAGGQVDIAEAGLALRDITLDLTADHTRHLRLEGTMRSGEGELRLSSESKLETIETLEARIRVEGSRFEVMNTPEIHSLISPDIEVAIAGAAATVNGTIEIPVTTVELKEIPPSAVTVSDDVVFTHVEEEPTAPPIEATAQLSVVLGDSVSFRGFGFSSRFTGHLTVIEEPGRPTHGTGELRLVEGRYKAYGQDLTIGSWGDSLAASQEPARIIFPGGPIDNPGLDMRAFREAKDGTIAGLRILGTARRPEITLFSEPPMSQGDALSYIMLGHKLGEGGGDDDMLANAAANLGLKGGNVLARSLGAKVGLDEAGIESEDGVDKAAFVAGKYVTPKLFISHGIGLFDRISTFRARYLLTPKWTVQAETGKGTGTDVLYRIERGR